MAKYNILGADRESGSEMQITVEAGSEAEARQAAAARGMVVSAIEEITQPPQVLVQPDLIDAVSKIEQSLRRVEGELHDVRALARRYPPGVRLNRWDITIGSFNAMLIYTLLSPIIALLFWIVWMVFGAAILSILAALHEALS